MVSPKLLIPELSVSQSQKEVTVNSGVIRTVDVLVQATIIDKDLATPPGSPADGDTYIVATSPTGAWIDHPTHIAYYQSSAWAFHIPTEGWLVYVQDENAFYYFTGTAWAIQSLAGLPTFLILTDTPSSYSGQAEKIMRVNTAANALEFVDAPYDISFFFPGTPGNDEVLVRLAFVRDVDFPSALTGSQLKAGTAATAEAIISLQKNDSEFGTATVAASGTTATFAAASPTSFAAGDILTVVGPATADATLASIGIALKGLNG